MWECYCFYSCNNANMLFLYFSHLHYLSLSPLQQSTMLFPSNHQDPATVQHHFLPKSCSLPHPRSPLCLHPPRPSFTPRSPSPSPSLSPGPVSLHPRRTASWAPSRHNLLKPCWKTTKSRRLPFPKPHPHRCHSVRSTRTCSRSSLGLLRRPSCHTHIRAHLRRSPPS